MAQITSVTSESLQQQIRTLLPSQQGFGEDLQASNVIVPIIDLTSTAEGSTVGTNLQTAFDYSITPFAISNSSSTSILTGQTGFFLVEATLVGRTANSVSIACGFTITNSGVSKIITQLKQSQGSVNGYQVNQQFVVFLRAGDSLEGFATGSVASQCNGSIRQIADINGTLVNPNGFTPQ